MAVLILRTSISAIAAFTDYRYGRIPNRLILVGFLLGSLILIPTSNRPLNLLLQMCYPVLALFPVFLIRGIGAGDLKLFSLLAFLSSVRSGLWIVFGSLVLSALVGLIRMIYRRELSLRLWNLRNYAFEAVVSGEIRNYQSIGTEGTYLHIGIYTFVLCVLVTLLELVGWEGVL